MNTRLVLSAVCGLLLAVVSGQSLDTLVCLPDSTVGLMNPDLVVYNELSGHYLVSSWANEMGGALIFDPAEVKKVGWLNVGGQFCIQPCPEVEKIFCAGNTNGNELWAVDARTETVLDRIALPKIPWNLDLICRSGTSGLVFVALHRATTFDGVVLAFDVVTHALVWQRSLPEQPVGMVWDSITDRLFVGIVHNDMLVLDCVSGDSVGTVPGVGGESMIVLPDARKLYCAYGAGPVYVVNPDSLRVIGSVSVPVARKLTYNLVYNRIYCDAGPNAYSDTVSVIDCLTDSVRALIGLKDPGDLACSPVTGHVYVACPDTFGVAVIDAGDSVVGWLPDGNRHHFDALGVSAEREEICCSMNEDSVLFVDAREDTVKSCIADEYCSITALLYNPTGQKLYLKVPTLRDAVLVLDTAYRVIRTIQVNQLRKDGSALLNRELDQMYLTETGVMWVIDCGTDEVVDSVPLPRTVVSSALLLPVQQKLYVLPSRALGSHDYWIRVVDCRTNEVLDSIAVGSSVLGAVYHPASDRVYFACAKSPNIRMLDPSTDSIVKSIDVWDECTAGVLLADSVREVVYFAYSHDNVNNLYTIDVHGDSVIRTCPAPDRVDAVFASRCQPKLYLCKYAATSGYTAVMDCDSNRIVGYLPFKPYEGGLMTDSTDRLYLGDTSGVCVIDCRSDSIVARLSDIIAPFGFACDAARGKVFVVGRPRTRVAVYSDTPTGLSSDSAPLASRRLDPSQVTGTLLLTGRGSAALLDVSGRRVVNLGSGPNDVSRLAPGVYFIAEGLGTRGQGSGRIRKVVITR